MYVSRQNEQNSLTKTFFIFPISWDPEYHCFRSWFSYVVSFFAGEPFDELRQQIVPIWTEKPGSNVRQHLD